jgi:DNA repair protein RadC
LVRALAGDESARRWREKGADDGIESVHDQNLIIIFMRQGGGISCSESPVTFGGEIL